MKRSMDTTEGTASSRRSFLWAVYAAFALALIAAGIFAVIRYSGNDSGDGPHDPRVFNTPDASTPEPTENAPNASATPRATNGPSRTHAANTPQPFVKTVICIDGRDTIVLASRQAAESLMSSVESYFETLDIIPPGAVTELVSEVELKDADPESDTIDYDSAFDYFTGQGSPLQFVSNVSFYQDNVIPHTDEVQYTDALPQGYRLVKVYGMDGVNRVTFSSTYINGVRREIAEKERFNVYPAIDGLVLIGTAKYNTHNAPAVDFGEEAPIPVGISLYAPIYGTVVRFYGMYEDGFSNGIDIACIDGTGVSAAGAGTVVSVLERGSYGLMVEIYHGGGVTTRYAHLAEAGVSVGDKVISGQYIGTVAGVMDYPHLHFEVRVGSYAYNPLKVLGNLEKLDLSYGTIE